ncbi:hypothetical protein CAEBREN_03049 [Caenorhabditis brenneri]|uniref:Gamma tubulin complex component C-terminal domain-containing protein n=1 Tax=Caenorhabditis brenneri TaxID=135651 RepID=G0P3L0_CAEBE|nr:hypothetical protein CAEBREN_03049 [Caenorhabditis brenneri]
MPHAADEVVQEFLNAFGFQHTVGVDVAPSDTHHNPMEGATSRSRANSSFTSYDNRMERPLAGSQRHRSPYTSAIPTTRVSPLTASNHLFSAANNGYSSQFRGTTPTPHHVAARFREEEQQQAYRTPPTTQMHLRQTTPTHLNTSLPITGSIRTPSSKVNTPLHSRLGNAITETESTVCECLLAALIGMETRLFTPMNRKMTITSTASISTTHLAVCQRVLSVANTFLELAKKEPPTAHPHGHVTTALLASIRQIVGDYIADIDEMRRVKGLRFVDCLPMIDRWQVRLSMVAIAHKNRYLPQLELLDALYVLHTAYSFDEDRRFVLDKLLNYTMGVFCGEMMEWMTTGEVPADKWMIDTDVQTGEVVLRKVPIFISDADARILLEIGKSLPHVGTASDEELEAIDKAANVVRAALSPQLILKKELTPILKILRDVVCGIVMRMVLTTGRLKEHIQKATSFFFLSDPRFTATLYAIIKYTSKDASMGLRVGSAALSRQTVSSALAAALESTTMTENSDEDKKKKKLKFTLDAMTSLGSTPNVSSRMQFVQPLCPRYEPQMELMKPIFAACDADYESIFHTIWSIDLARFSSQEVATWNLPGIMRFLVKKYSLRENASCILHMISHVFAVVNATLLRLRAIITVQLRQHLARFFAAIDEKCVNVDDVIREHQQFVRRVSVVVFVRNNEKIEHELANLLRIAFEAQEFCQEFSATWHEVIEATTNDENVRKARIAEICQKRTLGARMLLETVNKSHRTITNLIDEQITYGNDALIE